MEYEILLVILRALQTTWTSRIQLPGCLQVAYEAINNHPPPKEMSVQLDGVRNMVLSL